MWIIRDDIQQVAYLARVAAGKFYHIMSEVEKFTKNNPDHELTKNIADNELRGPIELDYTTSGAMKALEEFGDNVLVWENKENEKGV